MKAAIQIRCRGFTLVELTVVLVIIGLVMGFLLTATTGLLNVQRAEATRAKLKAIDAALASFVAINRRLPCPANGAIDAAGAGAGNELRAVGGGDSPCTLSGSSQAAGVVPWVAIGLTSADIEDGWGSRITYRLDYVLARNNALDMSACDPAGTGVAAPLGNPPSPSCTAVAGSPCTSTALAQCVRPELFLAGKGVRVNDGAGVALMDPALGTGAAYVLISHGENHSGGYGSSGALLAAVSADEGNLETANRADQAFVKDVTAYNDVPQIFTNDNTRFDDFVSRPSIITVAQRAHLGPRSH